MGGDSGGLYLHNTNIKILTVLHSNYILCFTGLCVDRHIGYFSFTLFCFSNVVVYGQVKSSKWTISTPRVSDIPIAKPQMVVGS